MAASLNSIRLRRAMGVQPSAVLVTKVVAIVDTEPQAVLGRAWLSGPLAELRAIRPQRSFGLPVKSRLVQLLSEAQSPLVAGIHVQRVKVSAIESIRECQTNFEIKLSFR